MAKTQKTVSYKGKTYRLLWTGSTKYGQRSHLQFMDGSKDFWVAASLTSEAVQSHLVTVAASQSSKSQDQGWRGNGCSACRAKGDWCDRCAFDEFDS